PDESWGSLPEARRLRRGRHDVPRVVQRGDLMVVERWRRMRNGGGVLDRPIDRGQRLVVARVRLIVLLFQASQYRLERFGSVIGHQAPVRPPAAAAAIRPSR